MTDLLPITIEDMIGEVRRELTQRRYVYPRLISAKKINHRQASSQLDTMQAVLDLLLELQRARYVLAAERNEQGGK